MCHSAKSQSGSRKTLGAEVAWNHKLAIEAEDDDLPLFVLGTGSTTPIQVDVSLNGVPVTMEVDTGAAVSVMSRRQQEELFPGAELQPSRISLRTYTAERVQVLGALPVQVTYGTQVKDLPLVIVQGEGPALLGRDWLGHIKLDWPVIAYHTVDKLELEGTLQRYQEVFRNELGTAKTPAVSLTLKDSSQLKFVRAWPVPFAIKEAVGREIDRLEEIGVLERVEFSRRATPIVPVPKSDGTFRLCGDYKVTLNAFLEVDQHPLPKPEEIFASLAGGQHFATLDLSQAYQQLVLDKASKELVTVSTHQGLYRYTRLPFGVASAPAIFQRTMDQVLHSLPGVMCYLDDIIITGATDQKHLSNLAAVLERLRVKGFRLKKDKCHFMQTTVEYLGHVIDANGLHTSPKECQAITEAPAPKNIIELISFLGLVNYYGRFVPNLASGLHPLNRLLRKGAAWA